MSESLKEKKPKHSRKKSHNLKKTKDLQFQRKADKPTKEELTLYRKYKTSLCRHFEETHVCELGPLCSFAHGRKELRHYTDVSTTPPF